MIGVQCSVHHRQICLIRIRGLVMGRGVHNSCVHIMHILLLASTLEYAY